MIGLNEHGLLPPGIHDCSLDELRELFGSFQQTERRPALFKKLRELVEQVSAFPFVRSIIVDGSFVTSRPDPQDIDLIVVVDPQILSRTELLNPFEYNAVSSRKLRSRYSFDVFVTPDGSGAYESYVKFFSRVKESPERSKGLVRLRLQ
jgi:hypothetical protein